MNEIIKNKVILLLTKYEANMAKYHKLEKDIDLLNEQILILKNGRNEMFDELNSLRNQERELYEELRMDPGFDEDAFKDEVTDLVKKIKDDGIKIDS